ncbi:MAG: YigZ family protein [Rikenellaceae bacterium]
MQEDTYKTILTDAEALYKEKSSKFLIYAYHIESEEQVKEYLEPLRKLHYDATHHCYAWRVGFRGEKFRANDDGEPSSTAGKPILGQLISHQVTNCLIVVVRYFGGTKLGVSGLIEAYRDSAALVLQQAQIVELTIDVIIDVDFSYLSMNSVMRIIKEEQPKIISQEFDNLCRMRLAIRESKSEILISKLNKVEGVILEVCNEE